MKKIAAVLLVLPIMAAADECRFKTSNAIVCDSTKGAAYAYQAFGFDIQRTNLDYNRQLLRESGCGRAYGATYKTDDVRAYRRGNIATANGWVSVDQVIVNDSGQWFVATNYLSCKPQEARPLN